MEVYLLVWTAKTELSENADVTTNYAVAGIVISRLSMRTKQQKDPKRPGSRYPFSFPSVGALFYPFWRQ